MKKILFSVIAIILIVCIFITGQRISKSTFYDTNSVNPILILDAGHGGLDGGAVSPNGVFESEITLEISLKSADICSFLGVPYTLTRESSESLEFDENASIRENKVSDTKARVDTVNDITYGFLVSIHLNNFSEPSSRGAQIFYNQDAEDYAVFFQNEINTDLDKNNNREAQVFPNTVYLIKNSIHPSVIFECGFLSNEFDESNLISDDYQTKLALMLVTSYQNYQKGILNETKNNFYV